MKLDPREEATIKFYDENSESYSQSRRVGSSSYWTPFLEKFKKLLPSGKVLEIGSGQGREAALLIPKYDYTGIDLSEALIKIAKQDNPTGNFIKMNFYELKFKPNTFDGFVSIASLLHVPKDKIEQTLRGIKRVVKPRAVGFITLKEGEGEEIDQSGRFFAYYQEEEFKKILEGTGFEVIETGKLQSKRTQTWWLEFLVRNNK